MSFPLFLIVTAVLFVRPQELFEQEAELATLPLYNWLIIACLIASFSQALAQLQWQTLKKHPLNLCVVGMLAAVFMSHAAHFDLWSARHLATEFSKTLVYYLLLVANVNSPERLRFLLVWILGCVAVVTAIALLQYHGAINLPSLAVLEYLDVNDDDGEGVFVKRLRGTGLFHDPNDLSMFLVLGLLLTAYFLTDLRLMLMTPPLLAGAGAFGYALVLTQSRGGMLALMAGLWTLFQARFGWKKAVFLAALVLPLMLVIFKGRQSNVGGGLSKGTGQDRIQLWSEGLAFFRESPIFGIGQNEYSERVHLVAHNSFVHSFAELGFFGGSIFLTAWLFPIRQIFRMGRRGVRIVDPRLGRLRPFMLAGVTGFATSMLTLSRGYVAPTYAVMGLAAVYLREAVTIPPLAGAQFDGKLVKFAVISSVVFLAAAYVFIRVFAKFG